MLSNKSGREGAHEGAETYKKLIKKIYLKAWLSSFVYALVFGCAANLVAAAITFYNGGKLYWIGFVVAFVVAAFLTLIFYRFKYRPTSLDIAREIDTLGLEERMITMDELKGETSYMAQIQREDAMRVLNKVNDKLMRITIPTALIIALSAVFAVSASMSVLSVLAASDVISGGGDIIADVTKPEPVYFELSYETDGSGFIEGDVFQVVESGFDGAPVLAVADDEWIFAGWSEKGEPWSPTVADKRGDSDPYRIDKKVVENAVFVAHFIKTENGDDFDPDGGGDSEADDADDKPPEEGVGQADDQEATSYEDGGTGGGKYVPHNQVIDGETYYGGDTYRAAYEDAMESLEEDDLPEDRKRLVSDYYDLIEKD